MGCCLSSSLVQPSPLKPENASEGDEPEHRSSAPPAAKAGDAAASAAQEPAEVVPPLTAERLRLIAQWVEAIPPADQLEAIVDPINVSDSVSISSAVGSTEPPSTSYAGSGNLTTSALKLQDSPGSPEAGTYSTRADTSTEPASKMASPKADATKKGF